MKRKTNAHPHDDFFRSVFYKPERCAGLLRLAAEQNEGLARFIETVDLATLSDISDSFVDENDKGCADLAFTVKLKDSGKDAKLLVGIIVEHKSYRDDEVFRQLIRYWHGLMVIRHDNIPTVAIILYNGRETWRPTEMPMFSDYPEYYHRISLPFICEFIDVGQALSQNAIKSIDAESAFALLMMKYAFEPEGLKDLRDDAHRIFFEIPQKERTSLVRKTMLYLTAVKRPEDKEEFMDFVTHRDVYGEPSLYEVLEKEYVDAHKDEWKAEGVKAGFQEGMGKGIRKGIQEGLQEGVSKGLREGKLQVARTMLADGMPLEKVARYSGLSTRELQQLV